MCHHEHQAFAARPRDLLSRGRGMRTKGQKEQRQVLEMSEIRKEAAGSG